MGGEDEGAAGFGFEDVVDDLLAGLVVEAGEGFVHEEEVGGGEEGADEGDAAAHAAGEFADRLREGVFREELREFCCRSCAGNHRRNGGDIGDRIKRLQEAVLLEDHADSEMCAGGRGLAHRDVDRAAVGFLEPREDAEQGRLADAGRAEQQEVAVVSLAVDVEAEVIEDPLAVVGFGEVIACKQHDFSFDCCRKAGGPAPEAQYSETGSI